MYVLSVYFARMSLNERIRTWYVRSQQQTDSVSSYDYVVTLKSNQSLFGPTCVHTYVRTRVMIQHTTLIATLREPPPHALLPNKAHSIKFENSAPTSLIITPSSLHAALYILIQIIT